MSGLPRPTEPDLAELAAQLWALDEREYHYAGCDILMRNVRACGPGFLATARMVITTKSWWDTVDVLASRVVGPLVASYPELQEAMDLWIGSNNIWLARSAILHQLGYEGRTDSERLFSYCLRRAADSEFFLRKAIGWALREYSKTDADAVRRFVAEHDADLSPLSKREALLWLNGGRRASQTRDS